MGLTASIRSRPLTFLFGLAAISLLGLMLFVPPIPQSQIYHGFADQRTLFGIPNFWNVVSNLPFVLVGAAGLHYLRSNLSAGVFFLGVFLTGFSSSYYHWAPDDAGLFWDRLPMSIAFMAILANQIEERIDADVGRKMLWPLVALGLVSLLVWRWTDDLRLYGWVQFAPLVAIVYMLIAYRGRYTHRVYLLGGLIFYALAKVFELGDSVVYSMTDRAISGHSIKHLLAAVSPYCVYLMLRKRSDAVT